MDDDLNINDILNNFSLDDPQPESANNIENYTSKTYEPNEQYLLSQRGNIWEYTDPEKPSSEKACPLFFTYGNMSDFYTHSTSMRISYIKQLQIVLDEIQKIFDEIYCCIVELMMMLDGNHLVTNLFEIATTNQRRKIILTIVLDLDNFLKIYRDDVGSLALKRLFRYMTCNEESQIASFMKNKMISLTKAENGCRFIKCCVECLSPRNAESVIHTVSQNCIELAMDKRGYILLQEFLDSIDKYDKKKLISNIISTAFSLSLDRHGNYVVQKLIEKSSARWKATLHDRFIGSYRYLSKDEFGSHVVEKLLLAAQGDERVFKHIIQELMMYISEISNNKFGNYVIRRALILSEGFVYKGLVLEIMRNEQVLRNNKHGKMVLKMIHETSSNNQAIAQLKFS